MTDDDIKRDRAIIDAATPDEWWINEYDGGICSGPNGPGAIEVGQVDFGSSDTAFLLAARTRWPAALAERLAGCYPIHSGRLLERLRLLLRSLRSTGCLLALPPGLSCHPYRQ